MVIKQNSKYGEFYDFSFKDLYSDGTIMCHGKLYPVHRIVLATCSEYFEQAFFATSKMNLGHPFIIVKDILPEYLEGLLSYMYTGEINISQNCLPELIKAAEAFKIRGLVTPDDDDNAVSLPTSTVLKDASVLDKSKSISYKKRVNKQNLPDSSLLHISNHLPNEESNDDLIDGESVDSCSSRNGGTPKMTSSNKSSPPIQLGDTTYNEKMKHGHKGNSDMSEFNGNHATNRCKVCSIFLFFFFRYFLVLIILPLTTHFFF